MAPYFYTHKIFLERKMTHLAIGNKYYIKDVVLFLLTQVHVVGSVNQE